MVGLIVLLNEHRSLLWAVFHRPFEELHDGVHSLKAVLSSKVLYLLNNFVLCFEMPVLGFLYRCSFGFRRWLHNRLAHPVCN